MKPGDNWTNADGEMFAVVLPDDVGDRPRWWISARLLEQYEMHNYRVGPGRKMGLHMNPLPSERDIVLALVKWA